MALVSCPECSGTVSERAVSCPRCGCPIAPGNAETSSPSAEPAAPSPPARADGGDNPPPPSPDRPRGIRPSVLLLALIVIGAAVYFLFGDEIVRFASTWSEDARTRPSQVAQVAAPVAPPIDLEYLKGAQVPVCGAGASDLLKAAPDRFTVALTGGKGTVDLGSCKWEVTAESYAPEQARGTPAGAGVLSLMLRPSGEWCGSDWVRMLVLLGGTRGHVECLRGFEASRRCSGLSELARLESRGGAEGGASVVASGACWRQSDQCCCPGGQGEATWSVSRTGAIKQSERCQ